MPVKSTGNGGRTEFVRSNASKPGLGKPSKLFARKPLETRAFLEGWSEKERKRKTRNVILVWPWAIRGRSRVHPCGPSDGCRTPHRTGRRTGGTDNLRHASGRRGTGSRGAARRRHHDRGRGHPTEQLPRHPVATGGSSARRRRTIRTADPCSDRVPPTTAPAPSGVKPSTGFCATAIAAIVRTKTERRVRCRTTPSLPAPPP